MEKWCSKCRLYKDEREFYTKHTACKRCVLLGKKEKYQKDSNYRTAILAASSAYQKSHPEKAKDKSLKQRHGITRQQYDMMLESQEGVCAICGQPETKIIKGTVCRLHVDHSHVTNEIRGLLCGKCNVALGAFNDDISVVVSSETP